MCGYMGSHTNSVMDEVAVCSLTLQGAGFDA